jgi:predicted secreted Zn-dependent protease
LTTPARRDLRVFVALLCLGVSVAWGQDAVTRYYDIVGGDERELRRELNAKGPIDRRGERVDGRTKWTVSWKFRYSPPDGGCAFTRIDVTLRGFIDLPRWAGEAAGAPSLVKKWRLFIDALRRHEEAHFAHGVSAAAEVEELGENFRVDTQCSMIGQAFNDEAKRIIDKYRAADAAFDARTRNGRTEGVRFP